MGWWADEEEPFAHHWDAAVAQMKRHRDAKETVWVMGDFNSPCDKSGEGYDYVKTSGWQDTYELALRKDSGITVSHVIDGWRNQENNGKGMRIDYIWCSRKTKIKASAVICNGEHYPVVSDHYGVVVET